MVATFHPKPPPPDVRIEEFHVWIAVQTNKSEGIISGDLPFEFGNRHVPLMSPKRHVAAGMERWARTAQRLSGEAGLPVEIELRTYRRVPS